MNSVVLKKGREGVFIQRHHWIFSGAVASYPKDYQDGDLVSVVSHQGQCLGWAFFNRRCSLAGRIVSFFEEDVYEAIKSNLIKAISLRDHSLRSPQTTAYRLVNGEGDSLPGLIIDQYGRYLVLQIGALGMRKLLPFLIEVLTATISLKGIYEKSTGGSLDEDGIEPQERTLWGEVPESVTILEEGIQFEVALKEGQKTGFFLDHREMRTLVRGIAKDKRVLNCFSYTGGFTLAAFCGGAAHVDSVDVSASALALCQKNVALNGFQSAGYYKEDVFDFLEQNACNYDLIILDPPAFAKKKRDLTAALRGYGRLFTLALQKAPKQSLLLFSSCSYYVTEDQFENTIRLAALGAKRSPRILGRHRLAFDHPINPFHPESSYLKSLLFSV